MEPPYVGYIFQTRSNALNQATYVAQQLTAKSGDLRSAGMATKTIQVTLPGELSGYVQRMVKGGRYQDASEVVRDALPRMEAAELADELTQFDRAFAGGHGRSEKEEDIQRVGSSGAGPA